MSPANSPTAQAGPSHRRVLIIEDNPDGRESLRWLLELLGYEVEVAEDGGRGLERALAWHPDAAVVDIGLPVMSGYEVAERVRAAGGRHILLIALTGYSAPDDRRRAYQAGFDVHLAKPADVSELSRWLATA
jgi:CheY-like chemotaxis protein